MGGLAAGDEVTAGQMWNLFGVGYHPLAEQLQNEAAGRPDATLAEVERAGRLGTPFQMNAGDVSPFRIEVARRLEAYNTAHGLPRNTATPPTSGPGSGPKWPLRCSPSGTGVLLRTRASWPGRWPGCRVQLLLRWRGLT